jgi:type IV pilus assembly protein PilY1
MTTERRGRSAVRDHLCRRLRQRHHDQQGLPGQYRQGGGGKAYTQTDAVGLTGALQEIFTDVVQGANSTFVSPTVAVNAFNRTRNLNSLFVSVFEPTARTHWPGNVKKYQFKSGQIYGANSAPAVDPNTGFFAEGNVRPVTTPRRPSPMAPTSRWVAWPANFPPGSRASIYTYLDGAGAVSDLTDAKNAFSTDNTAIPTSCWASVRTCAAPTSWNSCAAAT